MGRRCLKCGYERTEADAAPEYECPRCGVVYAKAEAAMGRDSSHAALSDEEKIRAIKERTALETQRRSREEKAVSGQVAEIDGNSKRLTKCKHCKREVSKAAKSCPHCGVANPGVTAKDIVLGLLGLIVVGWLVGQWFGSGDNSNRSTQPSAGYATSSTSTEWFRGGNLHTATVAQWRSATYANKLATASDWLSATIWKGALNTPSDLARLKRKAEMLVSAVDEVASADGAGSLQVNEMAAALITMSNDLGP